MTSPAISKNFALNGAHTAGIFADMTVDGPEIGTLVCVVDRAKNLPNRKTIGKQDPYCAARLGKEAKKTSTDIRGGQTPRWDQELRFTVHDTADYYQLKVSVFTDDKKTDLIGETWVDLKTIITSGGGQCDFWQTLTCRGKYAGEIRLEITYYDTRPKPDKSPPKPKPPSPDHNDMSPTKRRDVIKRRPVSMDPVTAEMMAPSPINVAAAAAAAANDPPRALPRQPVPHDYSYNSSSLRGSRQSLGTVGGPRELRALRKDAYMDNPRHSEERDLGQRIPESPRGEYGPSYASDREDAWQQPQQQQQQPHHHHQQHHHQQQQQQQQHHPLYHHHSGGSQSPPPPPPAHRARDESSDAMHRPSFEDASREAVFPTGMRHELLKHEPQRKASPSYPGRPKFRGAVPTGHGGSSSPPKTIAYNPATGRDLYDIYDPQRSMQPTVEDYPESEAGSFGGNVLRRPVPRGHLDQVAAPYDRGYDPRASSVVAPVSAAMSRSPVAAATGYLSQSPGQMANEHAPSDYRDSHRYTRSVPQLDHHREYDDAIVPAAAAAAISPSQAPYHVPGVRGRRQSPPYDNHSMPSNSSTNLRQTFRHPNTSSHSLHNVPASLAPGAESMLAHVDVSSRLHDDRRHDERMMRDERIMQEDRMLHEERMMQEERMMREERTMQEERMMREERILREERMREERMREERFQAAQSMAISTREHPRNDPQMYDPRGRPTQTYTNPVQRYDRGYDAKYYDGQDAQMPRRRDVSPNPPRSPNTHAIRRKSVSPAPPPISEARRLSDVPYGPDSYDTLNPTLSRGGTPGLDPESPSKIVMHDGREVDPSDHLPVESWAPEPEPKPTAQTPTETRSRPALTGSQPMPPNGRRQLRVRAQSTASPSRSSEDLRLTQGPAPPTMRGRLRKKADRSPAPAQSPSGLEGHASHSSDELLHDRHSQYSHRSRAPRSSGTWGGEYSPHDGYGSQYSGAGGGAYGPPIPAKLPLGMMSGAGGEVSLMEEMSKIDIGTGRSRRRGGH